MKKLLFVGVIAFISAACSGTAETETSEMHDHEHASPVYACPMECEGDKTYDEAGKCPVCGMDLEEQVADVH